MVSSPADAAPDRLLEPPPDGLPGVPGIDKTAATLIATHGSLAAVLASDRVPGAIRRRLDAAADYLAAARCVVLPVATVPLPRRSLALPVVPAHPRTLARLASAHRLETPIGRVQDALRARRASRGTP